MGSQHPGAGVTCAFCGQDSEHAYCCRSCRLADRREDARTGRRLYLNAVRGDAEPFPAFTAAMRTVLMNWRAWKHRVAPKAGAAILVCCLLAGCQKHPRAVTPQTSPDGMVANVAITPYDFVSPFVCRMTTTDLTCMASIDVRFRRGQLETQIQRGYQFRFHTPSGTGTGVVFFGCAGQNECGPGYFMFGSPDVKAVPVEPSRMWAGGDSVNVPYGSLGIVEIDIQSGQFASIRNRWAGSIAQPLLKAGPGTKVACTDQSCTISVQ